MSRHQDHLAWLRSQHARGLAGPPRIADPIVDVAAAEAVAAAGEGAGRQAEPGSSAKGSADKAAPPRAAEGYDVEVRRATGGGWYVQAWSLDGAQVYRGFGVGLGYQLREAQSAIQDHERAHQ